MIETLINLMSLSFINKIKKLAIIKNEIRNSRRY